MSSTQPSAGITTLAELVERLGGIPLDRIRYQPRPGMATVKDVIHIEQTENRLCELVDGVLVEKPMGFRESLLAVAISRRLHEHVSQGNWGLVVGADGMLQLFEGLIRIPDVSFVAWASLPTGKIPDDPAPLLAPDLAVEVLSRTNTAGEMKRKRGEYFSAGTKMVWIVDPEKRTVTVFDSPTESHEYGEEEALEGGTVLPGLRIPLRDLFGELDRRPG
jgi:Uma2 family endonuclease